MLCRMDAVCGKSCRCARPAKSSGSSKSATLCPPRFLWLTFVGAMPKRCSFWILSYSLDSHSPSSDDNSVPRDLAPLFLTEGSLDWAFEHVQRFGDGDIFPVAFEFSAFSAVW